MDKHIELYYSSQSDMGSEGKFHHTIALHDAPDGDCSFFKGLCPDLPDGWYQVVQLSTKDRLDFIHGYWLQHLPFQPHSEIAVNDFFSRVDEVCVYLVQPRQQDPFHAEMIYSLRDNAGFYRGKVPADTKDKNLLQELYDPKMVPSDYLAFLEVHRSFGKLMDSGVLAPEEIGEAYDRIQSLIACHSQPLVDVKKQLVEPSSLIPFYESFSLPSYQCFWGEWYPEDEMGNIYFSGLENTISNVLDRQLWPENMAFPTFLDWLAFYLEGIGV